MEIEAWRGNVELKMIQADPTAATLAHHELGRNVDKEPSQMMLGLRNSEYLHKNGHFCREKQPEEVRHSLESVECSGQGQGPALTHSRL